VDLKHGCWGDNSRNLEGETICMGTIFWWKETHRDVTVGVVITVEETDITVGTYIVTVEEGWFVTVIGA